MNFLKKNFILILLFLGQNTFLGRGQLRKMLIFILENLLLNSKNRKNKSPFFICKINSTPFYFYTDSKIGSKVWFGRNENYEIKFAKMILNNNFVFIDIGANFGLYTMNIAKNIFKYKEAKIISIEPDKINYQRLKKNIKILLKGNKNIFNQVFIENCAIGDKNQIKKLYLGHDNAVASLLQTKNFQSYERVRQIRLFDIIKKYNLKKISLIKIDIEGFEDRALLNFFESAHKKLYPKYIIIEHANKKNWEINILEYLFKLGYRTLWKNNNNSIIELKH